MKRQTEQLNSFHFQNVQVRHRISYPDLGSDHGPCEQLYAYGTLLNAIPLYTYYYKEVNSMGNPPLFQFGGHLLVRTQLTRCESLTRAGVLMLAGSDLLTAVTGKQSSNSQLSEGA